MIKESRKNLSALVVLGILFVIGVITIFNTQNSFGGADNISHYFAAHYGWKYPNLLFDHWSKPVFTILSSPFAQFGINGMRVFNLFLGLLTTFLAYKTAQILNNKSAFIVIIFTVLAPVYFILMFTSLTEICFSFFLVLGVYLFFSKKLYWAAILFSFLPIVRTEGIVLMPIFALVFLLRKSYLSILLLSVGFFIISLLGFYFYDSFFWLITEMPYSNGSIYGSGNWYDFISNTRYIIGYLNALLFLISLFLFLRKYIRNGIFNLGNDFYILLLIFAPFILYVSAHSVAWALGTGGSLGLTRVVGAVIPLATIGAAFAFEKVEIYLKQKYSWAVYVVYFFIIGFMFNSTYHIFRWGFFPSTREKLLIQASDYLKNNNLTDNRIVYFDSYLIYDLGIDPYDHVKSSWMINNRKEPSKDFPLNTIIVWDAHFGNNEGQMPLKNLMDDTNLVLLKKIVPDPPYKTLGGFDYEIDIFKKGKKIGGSFKRSYLLDYNMLPPVNEEDSLCSVVKSDIEFAPGIEIKTNDLCQYYTEFNVNVQFDFKSSQAGEIKDLILVLTFESGNNLVYKPQHVEDLVQNAQSWKTTKFKFQNIGLSPGIEILKLYLWNKGKNSFLLDNFKVEFEPTAKL